MPLCGPKITHDKVGLSKLRYHAIIQIYTVSSIVNLNSETIIYHVSEYHSDPYLIRNSTVKSSIMYCDYTVSTRINQN